MSTKEKLISTIREALDLNRTFDVTVRNGGDSLTISYRGESEKAESRVYNYFGLTRIEGIERDEELDETFINIDLIA